MFLSYVPQLGEFVSAVLAKTQNIQGLCVPTGNSNSVLSMNMFWMKSLSVQFRNEVQFTSTFKIFTFWGGGPDWKLLDLKLR